MAARRGEAEMLSIEKDFQKNPLQIPNNGYLFITWPFWPRKGSRQTEPKDIWIGRQGVTVTRCDCKRRG